jgi:hypothetical protein
LATVEALNSGSAPKFEIEMLAIVAEEAAIRVEVIYVICNSEPTEVPAPSEPITAPPRIPIIGCPPPPP